MSVFRVVVLCLALPLAVEAATGVQVTKFDTPADSFKSSYDADTSKFSEERMSPVSLSSIKVTASTWERLYLRLCRWRKTSIWEVFDNLKLSNSYYAMFGNPRFVSWAKYVEALEPGKKHAVSEALMSRVDDESLNAFIATAMWSKNPQAQKLAMYVQHGRFEVWREEGASPQHVWKYLLLGERDYFNLWLPLWVNYCESRYKYGLNDLVNELLEVGDREKLLRNFLLNPTTDEEAIRLYKGLLDHYESLGSVALFKQFFASRMHPKVDGDLFSMQYNIWKEVASMKSPAPEDELLFDALSANFGDVYILQFIMRSKRRIHPKRRQLAKIDEMCSKLTDRLISSIVQKDAEKIKAGEHWLQRDSQLEWYLKLAMEKLK